MPTTTISEFWIDCDIHRPYHCPWGDLQVPFVHAHYRLSDDIVDSCGLDTGTIIVRPSDDGLALTFRVYLDGQAEWGLEVGSVYFWDRYYRSQSAEFVRLVHVPGSAWPYAEAEVEIELAEPFDMTPHTGHSTAPLLIVGLRTVQIVAEPG